MAGRGAGLRRRFGQVLFVGGLLAVFGSGALVALGLLEFPPFGAFLACAAAMAGAALRQADPDPAATGPAGTAGRPEWAAALPRDEGGGDGAGGALGEADGGDAGDSGGGNGGGSA